jgi:hypothetical protein
MTDNEDNNLLSQGGAGNPNPQLVNINELKTIFSNPDIPVFYGDITKDSVTAKYICATNTDCSSNVPLVRCSNSWKFQISLERMCN